MGLNPLITGGSRYREASLLNSVGFDFLDKLGCFRSFYVTYLSFIGGECNAGIAGGQVVFAGDLENLSLIFVGVETNFYISFILSSRMIISMINYRNVSY